MWVQHVVALAAVFVCGILGSCLPIWMRHSRHVKESRRAYFLSVGSCFGGGVFVAASFIHLLADASLVLDVGAFETTCNATACTVTKLADPYPWSMLACSGGILFTMMVAEAVRGTMGGTADGTAEAGTGAGAGAWPNECPPAPPYTATAPLYTVRHDGATPARRSLFRPPPGDADAGDVEQGHHDRHHTAVAVATALSPPLCAQLVSPPAASAPSAAQGRSLGVNDDPGHLLLHPEIEICSPGGEFVAAAREGERRRAPERARKRGVLGAVMLFSALSFHSFIVGLALGLADNVFGTLFIAVVAHKSIAGFALGASFADATGEDGKPISKLAMSVHARHAPLRAAHGAPCTAFAVAPPPPLPALQTAPQSPAAAAASSSLFPQPWPSSALARVRALAPSLVPSAHACCRRP